MIQVRESNPKSKNKPKRGLRAQSIASQNFKKRLRDPPKEVKSPIPSATNMTTTRSQAPAMSTPQASSAQQEQESPESIPSQESPESIPSPGSTETTTSKHSSLSPEWVQSITIIMGHSLKFDIGQKLQKWVLYHAIHDPTNFWLSWDPTDSEDIRLLQKYVLLENNGSTAYLPSSTVKNLISLWNYMNLLIKQERPAEQKYNKLYYIMDEQWTKLTAHDMRTALVNENWKTRIHA